MVESRIIQTVKARNHGAADIQLAVAALMIEVVKADRKISRHEMVEVIETLRNDFNLDGAATGRLLELGGDVGNYIQQLESLTARVREQWSANDRLTLLKSLWMIAAADNDIDVREITLIEQVALLLEVDEKLALDARHEAEESIES